MASQPAVLEWLITDVAPGAIVQKAYAHSAAVGCEPTVANLRTDNDHLRWVQEGSTIRVQFDRDTFNCGSTQIDITVNDQLMIGPVGYYATNCQASPPQPPPSPPPPPRTPTYPPPSTSCPAGVYDVTMVATGGFAVAVFSVRPHYMVGLTLRTYAKGPSGAFLPQTVIGDRTGTFGTGRHTILVRLPPNPAKYQGDLYCGIWPREDLTWSNFSAYDAALIASGSVWN